MERTHFLNNPFWARYVRFYPIEWNQQIGMRVGLIGCPFTGPCFPGFFRVNDNANCVENLAFRKDTWVMTGSGKSRGGGTSGGGGDYWPSVAMRNSSSIRQWPLRSYRSPLLANGEKLSSKDGQSFYAVDGNEDNVLQKCAIMSNHQNDRPTLVIDLGKVMNVAGVLLKTWQGRVRNDSSNTESKTFLSNKTNMFDILRLLIILLLWFV